MAHKCPSYCHKCPDLGGKIMPSCYGTVVYADGWTDLSRCVCDRDKKGETDLLNDRIELLERKVAELMGKVEQLTQATS
jgi:hypothetical protein